MVHVPLCAACVQITAAPALYSPGLLGNPLCVPCLKGVQSEGFQELFQFKCCEVLHYCCQIHFRKLQFKNDYKCVFVFFLPEKIF